MSLQERKIIVNNNNSCHPPPPLPPSCSTPKSFTSQSQYSMSMSQNSSSSSFIEDDNWYSQLFLNRISDETAVFTPTNGPGNNRHPNNNGRKVKRSSTFNSDDLAVQTPSPSDSGIAELEGISRLREKDAEIAFLRETLEQNEQVIFKVYEEKQQSWQKEFAKLRSQFESSLQMYQQKAVRAEEQLLLQSQQRLEEKNKMKKDLDDALKTNIFLEDRLAEMTSENDSLKLALENCDRRRPLYHPTEASNQGEASSSPFKTQLEENIGLLSEQVQGLLTQRKTSESILQELKEQNKELQNRLGFMTQDLNTTKRAIEEEKLRWMIEKEKVLLYQKQLSQNNLMILKKNKELDSELRSLKEGYQIRTQEASY